MEAFKDVFAETFEDVFFCLEGSDALKIRISLP